MSETIKWPQPPKRWSYSTFRVARECPRRWALREIDVVQLNSRGSSQSPYLGRIRGRTCHAVLERMLELYRTHDGPNVASSQMIAFWKQHLPVGILGTTRSVLAGEIQRVARDESLDKTAVADLARQADAKLRDIVTFINSAFRIALSLLHDSVRRDRSTPPPLGVGLHPEVPVTAEVGRVSWVGHIDVVGVLADHLALFDFKTGKPSPDDRGQLELYSLLFALDQGKNPDRWTVDSLALLYSNGEVDQWEAPDQVALESRRATLGSDTQRIIADLGCVPPTARPEAARCTACEVRTHCDAYWQQPFAQRAGAVDVRVRVVSISADNEIRGTALGSNDRVVVLVRPTRPSSISVGKVIRVGGATVVFEGIEEQQAVRVVEANTSNLVVE